MTRILISEIHEGCIVAGSLFNEPSDKLRRHADASVPGQGPGSARMARGHEGGALLLIGQRHDPADDGAEG